jgi:hypothetical protein
VNGTSASSFGVVGITTENATSTSTGRAGVYGEDLSTNKNVHNSGVAGISKYGVGVSGQGQFGGSFSGSGNGNGVSGTAPGDGAGVEGTATGSGGTGVFGTGAIGVYAFSNNGTALFAVSNGTDGTIEANGAGGTVLTMTSMGGGDILQGSYLGDHNQGGTAVRIDNRGNEYLNGSLTQNGSTYARTHTTTGEDLTSYGARTSSPTLEDFGKGSLRQGSAHIALEPAYSSIIDPRSYMVFITPEGDSKGLYTTAITRSGFDVRENGEGRSTLEFSYRIVGRPLDTRAQRLPLMAKPSVPQSARRSPAAPVTR